MSNLNVTILFLYALGMTFGQVLFKLAADRAKAVEGNVFWISLFTTGYFYLSIVLYAVLTLAWFWILARVPLSRAYPFVALAFVLTPAFAAVLFDESIDVWYALSMALILGGLSIVVWKAN